MQALQRNHQFNYPKKILRNHDSPSSILPIPKHQQRLSPLLPPSLYSTTTTVLYHHRLSGNIALKYTIVSTAIILCTLLSPTTIYRGTFLQIYAFISRLLKELLGRNSNEKSIVFIDCSNLGFSAILFLWLNEFWDLGFDLFSSIL